MEWVTTTLILDQLRSGADATWHRFSDRFRGPVVALGLKLGLPPPAADDAAQETMLALFEGLRTGRYERGRGRLSSWLFGIATVKIRQVRDRLARDARDRVGNPSDGTEIDALPLPDERELQQTWDTSWARAILDQSLAQVRSEVDPPTYRAFEMVQLEGKSATDAAATLGMSRNAVFIAKHRVLKRLGALKKDLDDTT